MCGDLAVDPVEGIGALIECSLLLPGTTADDVRFRWLRVIREYAARMLDESGDREVAEAAHATAYLALAEHAPERILGQERRRWIEALERDHDNLRAAISWAIGRGETDMALRFSWALWRFWQTRHIHEASGVIEQILAMPGGDERLRAKALEASGGIAWWRGDMERADLTYLDVLERQRMLGDPAEIANALYNAGLTQAYGFRQGDAARALFAEAEAIYTELGDVGGLGNVHWGMGSLAFLGEAEAFESRPLLERAVDEYRRSGNVFGEGWAHFELAALLIGRGEAAEAVPHLESGLELLWQSRDYSAVVMFVMLFAWVAHELGDRERAVRLAGSAYRLRDRTGVDIMSIEANRIEGMQLEDMEALEGDLAVAYAEGRTMGYDEAVACALRTS